MKKLLWTAWCLVPLGVGAYHYGPGQERVRLDETARAIAEGEGHARRACELAATSGDEAAREEWGLASAAFAQALELLPAERVHERMRLELERAKCRMFLSQLPEANAALAALVEDMQQDGGVPTELLADARRTLANSEYYMTWLLRLEGAGRDQWEPRIEAARQTYKLLALDEGADEAQRAADREDLESAVRLARMELGELQGLPLPSQ